MDTATRLAYIQYIEMLQQCTTIFILSAITLQAVFGGLQHSVSICLGGGHDHHAHEQIEETEHCELECSHHDRWATPIEHDEDVADCECTDVEFGLVTLHATLRKITQCPIPAPLALLDIETRLNRQNVLLRGPPKLQPFYIPAKQHQLVVVRTTRFLI
ncbi:MAG: hypothetical protein QGI78_09055 [Phycisphaerales bacterium]|jgi:hypothetical protein|nr:hypothetical protein [Phycisphaerales bacterium]